MIQGRTIIDVIHGTVWILRIIYNERATKAVAVLKVVMGVVPERARLVRHVELIEE